jgi:hypothetical protein
MESHDMINFLDETGKISDSLSKEKKGIAIFLGLIIEAATKVFPIPISKTDIKCINTKCNGRINTHLRNSRENIQWYCPICQINGEITNWYGTQWDLFNK